jgi:protein SERAC1
MAEVTLNKVNSSNINSKVIGNVIFVHGLDGHPQNSWTNAQGGFFPGWLIEDLPQLNFWTIGYPANSSAWVGNAMPLQDRATNILEKLVNTKELGNKPIVFVTHSMGGLVVKQMLNTAETMNIERYKQFIANNIGVVFIATPHDGAGIANLVNFFKPVFRANMAEKAQRCDTGSHIRFMALQREINHSFFRNI